MTRTKKILSVLLAVSILCSVVPSALAAEPAGPFKSQKLNSKTFLDAYSLGVPHTQSIGIDSVAGMEDGVPMVYATSSGKPGNFNVIDIENEKLVRSFSMGDSTSSWSHITDGKGNVWIAGCEPAQLYKYDTKTKEFKGYGQAFKQGAAYNLTLDEEGNVYFGTFPNAYVVKFDINTEQYENLGQVFPNERYARSIEYYKGKIYAGGQSDNTKMVEMDLKTKKITEIPLPQLDGKTIKPTTVYTMRRSRQYIFVNLNGKFGDYGEWIQCVYNADTGKWMDILTNAGSLYASTEFEGDVYLKANDKLCIFHLDTGTLERTEKPYTWSPRGVTGVYVNGRKCLATADYSGYAGVYDIEKGEYRKITEAPMKGTGAVLQSLVCNTETDRLYCGSVMGASCAEIDGKTGKLIRRFSLGQPEGLYIENNTMYAGIYPAGQFDKLEIGAPDDQEVKRTKLFTFGEEQQRPYIIKPMEDDYFIIGSVPNYGQLGGALTIYNKKTNEFKVYRNVVQDQSVVGLAYKDGLIYGATCISGGLGTNPSQPSAKLFVFDPKIGQKTKEWVPQFPSRMGTPIQHIGDLEVGPDGNIWGACQEMLFCMDPKTQDIKKTLFLNDVKWYEGSLWRPVYLRWGKDGLLYTSQGNVPNVIDIDTMEYIRLTKQAGGSSPMISLDSQDNIYITVDTELRKICSVPRKLDNAALRNIYQGTDGGMALFVDNRYAIVNGGMAQIDPENIDVTPIVKDDRTLVPVRFIAESIGASVGWDDPTQTVTVNRGSDVIKLVLGSDKMLVNGTEQTLDVPAQTLNDRTLLPLRAIVEALGQKVFWDDRGLIVIQSDESKLPSDKTVIDDTVYFFDSYATAEYSKYTDKKVILDAHKEYNEKYAANKVEVPNFSFENGTVGTKEIDNWKLLTKNGENTDYYLSDEMAIDGEKALYLEDTNTKGGVGVMVDAIPVKEGAKRYVMKTDMFITEGRCSIYLRFLDANKKEIKSEANHVETGVGEWQTAVIDAEVPAGTAYVQPLMNVTAFFMTKAYYDNVQLYAFDK